MTNTSKGTFILIIVCFSCNIQFAFSQDSNFKINSYEITLNLDSINNILSVSSDMEIEKSGTTDEIILLKNPYMSFKNISIKSNLQNQFMKFEAIGEDSIRIKLGKEFNTENKFQIIFNYTLTKDTLSNGSILLYEWYPFIKNNITKWQVRFNIPDSYMVFLSAGNNYVTINESQNIKNFTNVKETLPRLTLLMIKSNKYIRYEEKINELGVNYYFFSKDTSVINRIISETKNSLTFYISLVGQYPYKHLNLIEIPDEQYINSQPGMVLMGSLFIDHFNDGFNEWMAHETAHQWFGSGVQARYGERGNSCFFEPIAEYLKLMYFEHEFGEDTLNSRLKNIIDEYSSTIYQTDKDVPVMEGNAKRVVYLKGPYIMHKVRKSIGDSDWIQLLRNIYSSYKGIFFTYKDFCESLSKYDTNGAFVNKFKDWMEHAGMPE